MAVSFRDAETQARGVNHLPKGAKQKNQDWSPIQSLSDKSLVVGKEGSIGRRDRQAARSRGAADFRERREAHA